MQDNQLTDAQRFSLRCYIETEGKDITPTFVFRFYIRQLSRCSYAFVLVSCGTLIFVPSAPAISLRSAILLLTGGLFVGLVALSAWTSAASVDHWRLLQRILDWDRVRRLYNTADPGADRKDGG